MTVLSGKRSLFYIIPVSLFVALFVLLFTEAALRMGDFRFDTQPRYMEFNFPNPHEMHEIFQPDVVTFWRLRPGARMGDGIEPINSIGFRGPEFSEEKSPGAKRVITLGDSVTFGGATSYPQLLAGCLDGGWEVINAGVPGYSVVQGWKLYESRIAKLKPDVVTIMFGWNDHWLARGIPDSQQAVKPSTELSKPINWFKGLRIYQLLNYIIYHNVQSPHRFSPATYRVPIEEYKNYMERLTDAAKSSGAQVILITAPSAFDAGKVPAYLLELGFVQRLEGENEKDLALRLNRLHASYNDVTRAVAAEKAVALVDLDSQWRNKGITGLFRDPAKDIVHPNEEGYRLIGETLCDTIKSIRFRQ